MLRVVGRVRPEQGALLTPEVRAVQMLGALRQEQEVSVADDGTFSCSVSAVPTAVYLSAADCYSAVAAVSAGDAVDGLVDLGTLVLRPLPRHKLFVTLYEIASTTDGNGARSALQSFENVEFRITDLSQDRELHSFTVQYPYLIMEDDELGAGDRLQIAASSPGRADGTATVTLDNDGSADAAIDLVQNGALRVEHVDASEGAYLLLFDGTGSFLKRETPTAHGSLTTDVLAPGSYTAILIRKDPMFRSISGLSRLDDFGLIAGEDYVRRNVEIRDGLITELGHVAVPDLDMSRLYYTVEEDTGLTVNKLTLTTGEMALVRLDFRLRQGLQTANETVLLELPKGLQLVNGSLILNGKKVSGQFDADAYSVAVEAASGSLSFYVLSYEIGEYPLSALLRFNAGEETVLQPLGALSLQVEAFSMYLPETVSNTSVPVYGKALPNIPVTLYDGDRPIAEIQSNARGDWSARIDLVQPYPLSLHLIRAKYLIDNGTVIESEHRLLRYNPESYCVSRVVMHNFAHPPFGGYITYETVFDFLSPPPTQRVYSYSPSYPTFSFTVEFDGETPTEGDLELLIYTESGETVTLEPVYDPVTGTWSCSATFLTGSRPVNVGVRFEAERGYSPTVDGLNAAASGTSEKQTGGSGMNLVPLDPEQGLYAYDGGSLRLSHTLRAGGPTEDGNAVTTVYQPVDGGPVRFTLLTVDGEEEALLRIEISTDPETARRLPKLFDPSDLEAVTAEQEPETVTVTTELFFRSEIQDNAQGRAEEAELMAPGDTPQPAPRPVGILESVRLGFNSDYRREREQEMLGRAIACILSRINDMEQNADPSVLDGISQLINQDRLNAYRNAYDRVQQGCQNLDGISENLGDVAEQLENLNVEIPYAQLAQEALNDTALAMEFANQTAMLVNLTQWSNWLDSYSRNCPPSCGCGIVGTLNMGCCRDCARRPRNYPGRNLIILDDPSGYVYEAVPSNRLSGVTAVLLSEEEGVWNAEDYGQVNPQTTGSDGMFYWDVPQGNWKVTFQKEGYLDTDTSGLSESVDGWLPVPPPKVDLAVEMISTQAPAVFAVMAYDDRCELRFTQYMDIDSVLSAVSLESGAAVEVLSLNAEDNLDGTARYASYFKVTPLSGTLSEVDRLHVAETARNYAGTPLSAAYSSEPMEPEVRPRAIHVTEIVELKLHQSTETVLRLLPGIPGKTLRVEALTPSIVSVDAAAVVTDADGAASVLLNGLLPGVGMLRVTESDSGLSALIQVEILREALQEESAGVLSVWQEDEKLNIYATASQEGLCICAAYDANGQMLRFDTKHASAGSALEWKSPALSAAEVRLFLTEEGTLRPLAAAVLKQTD